MQANSLVLSDVSRYEALSRLISAMALSLVAHLALFGFLLWMVSPYWGASPKRTTSSILTVKVAPYFPDSPPKIGEGRLEKPRKITPQVMQVETTPDVSTVKRRSRSIGQNKSIGNEAVTPAAPSKYGREISSLQAGVPDTAGDTSATRQMAVTSRFTPSEMVREKSYLADLYAAIAGHKFYPEQARREGREGRVVISVTIRRDGEFTNVTVVEPSGSRLLDRAASKAVRRLGRFRPFSNQIEDSALTTQIAFTYQLEN